MNEKLLENWLDNASERSYQAVFAQMLAAQGYTVVHSTRHCALEFGKDILAVAADGVGCAFQLKGNPSSRLTLDAFRREIQPQLHQMVTQPPAFPGFPNDPFRAYLVTNGTIDEEVQVAVAQMNAGRYLAKIELISRGMMLDWAMQLGKAAWPSELKDDLALLQLYLSDPNDVLPVDLLVDVLYPLFDLKAAQPRATSAAELDRLASSAALLTGIATGRFSEQENHLSCIQAWVVFCVTLIAAVEARGAKWSSSLRASLSLGEAAIRDGLVGLWDEVKNRRWLVEGSPMSDPEVYGWRLGQLLGVLSCLSMAVDDKSELIADNEKRALDDWLGSRAAQATVWGEGAIASLVPWLLHCRKHKATLQPDHEIANLAHLIIRANQPKSEDALASPYYGIYEVLDGDLSTDVSERPKPTRVNRETFAGSAFTAESLMHLVARTGLKSVCKSIWPAYTKLALRSFQWSNPWEYCLYRAKGGKEVTKIPPPTYSWSQLRKDAVTMTEERFPTVLRGRPWLMALWWQVAPHRFCDSSCKVVASRYLPGWGT